MKYAFFFISLFLFFISESNAQDAALYEESTSLLYRNEMTFGAVVHTQGWGLIFRRGVHLTGTKKRMFEAEMVSMHHPKETKSHFFDDAKPFVYGKLNYLVIARTGIGYQKVLYRKGDRSGVEIRLHYAGGFSFGITKPVYLYIIKRSGTVGSGTESLKEVERYDPEDPHQSIGDIYGRADFSYGLERLGVTPGGYLRTSFSFEFGKNDNAIKMIEAGIVADRFIKTIPLMAYTRNNPYFVSLYLSISLGNKW